MVQKRTIDWNVGTRNVVVFVSLMWLFILSFFLLFLVLLVFSTHVLLFQIHRFTHRYLLISGSRPGGRPLNLQGLWANSLKAKWEGDYHMNINLQVI